MFNVVVEHFCVIRSMKVDDRLGCVESQIHLLVDVSTKSKLDSVDRV